MRVHRTLADAYQMRVVGAREDNVEHAIHHLTKALENVSVEEPASMTDHPFGKGPLFGHAGPWSEVMSLLGFAYGARVKVSYEFVIHGKECLCLLNEGVKKRDRKGLLRFRVTWLLPNEQIASHSLSQYST
jgi:hypothetical protein